MIVTCKKCKKDFTWIRYCAEDDIPPELCSSCTVHYDTIKVSLDAVRDRLLRFEDWEHANRIASAILSSIDPKLVLLKSPMEAKIRGDKK